MKKELIFATVFICQLIGLPTGPEFDDASVTITHDLKSMVIECSLGATISWEDFSIDEGESVHFIHDSDECVVYNHVRGVHQSRIDGYLNCGAGPIILINRNGFEFGNDVSIDGYFTTKIADMEGTASF